LATLADAAAATGLQVFAQGYLWDRPHALLSTAVHKGRAYSKAVCQRRPIQVAT
jgi:hypothetical protein